MKHGKSRYLNAMAALLAFLSVSCSLALAQAQAQSLIDASNPQGILNIARGYGSADLTTDSTGDPKITGRTEGIAYSVWFYGCSDGRNCKSIQFSSGWVSDRVSLRDVNRWNKTKRFGKAYLDDDDDPILEMNVTLDGGVSRSNLDDAFDWWKVVLVAFKNEFNL